MTESAVSWLATIAWLVALALLALAAASDLASRIVPDRASLGIALAGAVLRLQDSTLAPAVAVALVVFGAALICWHRGWLGGGDVKLIAAAALLVPPGRVPGLVAAILLAGGALALIYLALGALLPAPAASAPSGRLARIARIERRRMHHRGPLPYACAIVAGTLYTAAALGMRG